MSTLSLQSTRARNARYARVWCRNWVQRLLQAVVVLGLLLFLSLLWITSPLAWIALSVVSLCVILLSWSAGSLKNIKPVQSGSVDGLLEPSVMARLKTDNPSAKQVWEAIKNTEPAYFLSNRYLIDASFFDHFLDETEGSAQTVWTIAEQYRLAHNQEAYSAIILLIALVQSVPDHEQLLRTIQVSLSDIETAIDWHEDTEARIRLARQKNSFGGIGRDWAFGYTPLLQQLGHNISREIQTNGFFKDTQTHEVVVTQVISALSAGGSAVTLIGDTGVGKTTCVYSLAERLLTDSQLPKSIRYTQVVELDAPTLIANTQGSGQLEQYILRALHEASRAGNILLFFDNAEAFFGAGPSSVDLSHLLQPVIENGAVRIVLAMTPVTWQQFGNVTAIARTQPIQVPPLGEQDAVKVLRNSVFLPEYKHKVVFTYQALQEAYKLGARYVNNLAMPGAALSVIDQASTAARSQLITADDIRFAVEQAYGVKLQVSTGAESGQLLELESEIKKHVISQDRAITVVSDALRRARSGVGNPNRPVGTFLFLGPTGVGKTELAKALARVYYSDEQAIIRLDMNQFVQSSDVSRLIEVSADSGELSFVGKLKKQPFCVVLLDEIEKAHSSVINTFLQALDEGIMRSSDGKEVSLRDAIIIATSNAGADSIRQMIDSGQSLEGAEARFTDLLISQGAFAPEFINRFDEVVVFAPLTLPDLLQVIDIIIAGINKTLDNQKVQISLTDPAKQWLAEKGYDPKLGARPMRRMTQRYVENLVAKKLLDGSLSSGGSIALDVSDFEQQN